jgi:hypothetical protein
VDRTDDRLAAFSTGLLAEDLATQSLFRVHYQGEAGSGAFRLVLKLESAERYLIETKDRFGRGLWRIEADHSGALMVDDRRQVFCSSDGGIRIPELALELLPLDDLPTILLGRLPGDLEAVAGDGEYRDGHGRRWTVATDGAEISRWTLWAVGEPWVWWRREGRGEGVLSHRAGTQLSWKRVAGESMKGEVSRLVPASDYRKVTCEDWPGRTEAGGDGD